MSQSISPSIWIHLVFQYFGFYISELCLSLFCRLSFTLFFFWDSCVVFVFPSSFDALQGHRSSFVVKVPNFSTIHKAHIHISSANIKISSSSFSSQIVITLRTWNSIYFSDLFSFTEIWFKPVEQCASSTYRCEFSKKCCMMNRVKFFWEVDKNDWENEKIFINFY